MGQATLDAGQAGDFLLGLSGRVRRVFQEIGFQLAPVLLQLATRWRDVDVAQGRQATLDELMQITNIPFTTRIVTCARRDLNFLA